MIRPKRDLFQTIAIAAVMLLWVLLLAFICFGCRAHPAPVLLRWAV